MPSGLVFPPPFTVSSHSLKKLGKVDTLVVFLTFGFILLYPSLFRSAFCLSCYLIYVIKQILLHTNQSIFLRNS